MKNKKKKSFFYMYIFPAILISALFFGLLDIFVFNWIYEPEPHFKIYLNETEVDEMIICCIYSPPINNTGNLLGEKSYCMPEENLEYFEVPCEPLKKDDLTIEWLDWNAECVNNDCPLKKQNKFFACDENYCQKYKFGKYIIERWNQIK